MIKSILKKMFKKELPAPAVPAYYQSYDITDFMNIKPEYKKYKIGNFSYGTPLIKDYSHEDDIATIATNLSIGKYCSLARDVQIILGSEHRIDWISTYPFNALSPKFRHIKGHPSSHGDVIIGNDVWIASNVTILSGVTIGDGVVIGANSLVNRNIPAYSVAVGVPARVIRLRFSEQIINELNEIKWWDLPLEIIEKHVELLQSSDISNFIKTIKNLKTV